METIKWADAWQQLVYEHTPFRAGDDLDFKDLLARAGALEELFLSRPSLQTYSEEWVQVGARRDGRETPAHSHSEVVPAIPAETIHIAAIQLQLMEDAFYFLRLDRFANAPDNRGWMNLFRRWGGSGTFRQHVRELEATFSRQFVDFYYHYVENWPPDVPVPHPWDLRTAAVKPVHAYAGVTKDGIDRCSAYAADGKSGKGIFLDPGRVEAGPPQAFDEPLPVQEDQRSGERADSSGGAAPQKPATDSSKSTD